MKNPTTNHDTDIPEFGIKATLNGGVFLLNGVRMTNREILTRLKRGANAERQLALLEKTGQEP